jgi:hypothetical protein
MGGPTTPLRDRVNIRFWESTRHIDTLLTNSVGCDDWKVQILMSDPTAQLFEEHAIIEAIEEFEIINSTTTEGFHDDVDIVAGEADVDVDCSQYQHLHHTHDQADAYEYHHHGEFSNNSYFPGNENRDFVEEGEGTRRVNHDNDVDSSHQNHNHDHQLALEHETVAFTSCDIDGDAHSNNSHHHQQQGQQHQHHHHYEDYDHNFSIPSISAMAVPAHKEAESEVVVNGSEIKEEDEATATTSATLRRRTTHDVGMKRKEPSTDVDDVEIEPSMNVVIPTANAPDEVRMGNSDATITTPRTVTRNVPEWNTTPIPTTTTVPSLRTRVPWDVRMKQLVDYKSEHGHLLIPIRHKPSPSLGKFVHNTREQYKLYNNNNNNDGLTTKIYGRAGAKRPKNCSLTAERIDELQKLGFVWNTDRTQKETDEWMDKYTKLVR